MDEPDSLASIEVLTRTRWELLARWLKIQPRRTRRALLYAATALVALLLAGAGLGMLLLGPGAQGLILFVLALIAAGVLGVLTRPPQQELAPMLSDVREHAAAVAEGRVPTETLERELAITDGIPLAVSSGVMLGISPARGQEGHLLVIGPTRSGKGLHLSEMLARWPHAALVIDPKGEQYERYAGARARRGPVFRLPGDAIRLARYYNLRRHDDITELHLHLIRPWLDGSNSIFASKSRQIFAAVALHAYAQGRDPIRAIIGASRLPITRVLTALERTCPDLARAITDGLEPAHVTENRFATSVWGTFSARMFDYYDHADVIAPSPDAPVPPTLVPLGWADQNATIFITYSLNDLAAVGPLVASIIAALMRYQVATLSTTPVLFAIDEMPHVSIRNLPTYMAMVGGYGCTVVPYAQSLAQLEEVYGRAGAQTLLANAAHQLYYPPNDQTTAEELSRRFGTSLKTFIDSTMWQTSAGVDQAPRVRYSERREPALQPAALMSLPSERVLVFTQAQRQYRFVAERCDPRAAFAALPPPPIRAMRAAVPVPRPAAAPVAGTPPGVGPVPVPAGGATGGAAAAEAVPGAGGTVAAPASTAVPPEAAEPAKPEALAPPCEAAAPADPPAPAPRPRPAALDTRGPRLSLFS